MNLIFFNFLSQMTALSVPFQSAISWHLILKDDISVSTFFFTSLVFIQIFQGRLPIVEIQKKYGINFPHFGQTPPHFIPLDELAHSKLF